MSEAFFTTEDGCRLAFVDIGNGQPVLWQHGLGADRVQPAEVFPELHVYRRITLECRGHGKSQLGAPNKLSIAQFTNDACQLLAYLGIERLIVGGISLGAGIGLRLAAKWPQLVSGLILARPAWFDGPSLETQAAYRSVAELIRDSGIEEGARLFESSERLARIETVSPDNAKSLRWFFTRDNPQTTVELLSRIPLDCPGVSKASISKIVAKTLVIGNDQDDAHPLRYAEALAATIPHSTFRSITSKSADRASYIKEFQAAIHGFLSSERFE